MVVQIRYSGAVGCRGYDTPCATPRSIFIIGFTMKKTLLLLLAAATLVVPCTLTSCGGGGGGVGGSIRGEVNPAAKFLTNKTIEIYRPGTDKLTIDLRNYIGTKSVEGRFLFGSSEVFQGLMTIDSYTLSGEALETLDCRFSISKETVVDEVGWSTFWGVGPSYTHLTPKEDVILHLKITARPTGNLWEGTAEGSCVFTAANKADLTNVVDDLEGTIPTSTMFIKSK